ncbi:hypothetical protein BJX70DRAFT_96071 [Aspergillus crustosus]
MSRFAKGPRSRFDRGKGEESDASDRDSRVDEHNNNEEVKSSYGGENNDEGECDGADNGSLNHKSADRAAMAGIRSILLIHFFDATTNQALEGTKSRVLPNEILIRIMDLSDHQTYLSLARVSSCCRDLYYRKFRLYDDNAIVSQGSRFWSESITIEHLESGYKTPSSLSLKFPHWSTKKAEWAVDKRRPNQRYTFWIALIALALALVLGLI